MYIPTVVTAMPLLTGLSSYNMLWYAAAIFIMFLYSNKPSTYL